MNKRILSSLGKLVELSRAFGRQDRDWVNPKEGNTSVRVSENSFFVKASGSCLGSAQVSDFTEIDLAKAFDYVGSEELSEDTLNVALESIKVDSRGRRPSVETFLHAVCLRECTWAAHCYPASVLSVLKEAGRAKDFFAGDLDLLSETMLVPYVDTPFELAFAVRKGLLAYTAEHCTFPKVIFLGGHSLFILGKSEHELLGTMETLDKYAHGILAD